MANRFPMWWVTQRTSCRRPPVQHPPHTDAAPPPPPLSPPPHKTERLHIPPQVQALLSGLDGDTVLVLILILLLRRENQQTDRGLLLALAYILM